MPKYVDRALIYTFLLVLPIECEASENESSVQNRSRVISQNADIIHLILNPEELAGKQLFYYPHNTEFFTEEHGDKENPVKLEFLKAEYKKTRQFYFDARKPNSASIEDKEGVLNRLRSKKFVIPKFDEKKFMLSISDSHTLQSEMPKTTVTYELILYFRQIQSIGS